MSLRCITVYQPWASLIAAGVKTIETRSWPTNVRGRIGIASDETFEHTEDAWLTLGCAGLVDEPGVWPTLPTGAIVATAELVDCAPIVRFNDERWAELAKTHAPRWVEHVVDQDPLPPGARGLFIADNEWGDYNARLSGRTITDQLPYGDFTCGRWAWLLADVKPTTERCPACWGTCVLKVRCGTPEQAPCGKCNCDFCPACDAEGICPPIPAKGRQGWWRWEP